MKIKASEITAEFIKEQAAQGNKVVKITHNDGSVTYETRPIEPVKEPAPHQVRENKPIENQQNLKLNTNGNSFVSRTNNTSRKAKTKSRANKLISLILIPLILAGGVGAVYTYGNETVEQYNNANQVYNIDKVKEDLKFYGGDSRYVDKNLTLFGLKKTELNTHFNIGEERAIKVGYSSNISEEYKQQFQHTFDYVNSIFKVINPNIRFEIVSDSQKNCDVWIQGKPLKKDAGMSIQIETDRINASQITGATINVNSNLELSTPQQRFYLIHELLHLLTGSADVNYYQSPTFSVYNYNDMGFIVSQVETAWESEEEKKEATNGHFATLRPVLTAEEKNSWVTYLPTDIGTLIALYGDSSIPSNKEAYITLLNETLKDCSEKFGKYQPYFVDDFVVPQNSTTDTDDDDLSY